MANKKQHHGLNVDLGLYMADSYMKTAKRAVLELNKSKSKGGPVCLTISSLAFSLEVYFKSILYCLDERQQATGHDLVKLWKKLPNEIQDWFSNNFDKNFKSTGKDWTYTVFFNPNLGRNIAKAKLKPPNASVQDIIKGHSEAFTVGRYAYELPPPKKLKPIPYNLEGLQVLAFLARGFAYHIHEQVRKVKEAAKGKKGRQQGKLGFPNGVTEKMKYPED